MLVDSASESLSHLLLSIVFTVQTCAAAFYLLAVHMFWVAAPNNSDFLTEWAFLLVLLAPFVSVLISSLHCLCSCRNERPQMFWAHAFSLILLAFSIIASCNIKVILDLKMCPEEKTITDGMCRDQQRGRMFWFAAAIILTAVETVSLGATVYRRKELSNTL
ncbi:Uncharacterized protein PBTT_05841 [Plasmodiophora brassicae]|uniref:Uncharacterized protein n=1 Tax=Plasmodiophora brassicae TaxID=37360 RepID=A0A3P3YFZ4_PLABS|nr:unnamed protein product [Plasmodiophora brassicae]